MWLAKRWEGASRSGEITARGVRLKEEGIHEIFPLALATEYSPFVNSKYLAAVITV
jgi:hypothetical protein